jgi:hypothetical protein
MQQAAWGAQQAVVLQQQLQQGWGVPQQQAAAPGMMGQQQQWQAQPQMQQWQDPVQQQQLQWQQAQMAAAAAAPQQQWQQGQEQWQQAQQQPQAQQWPQQQPQAQPKPAGKDNWRELWHQQLQQQQLQQQQQQWAQGMPAQQQQWGQAMAGGQAYGANMYNQQQAGMGYNYNYGQQHQQPQQPPPPSGRPQVSSQQAWGGASTYQQQQQGSALPSPQGPGSTMAGARVGLQQPSAMPQQPAQAPTPAAPAAPPSPPKPLDLSQLLLPPGRNSRPKRLLLLLRGPPGCGKSHLARTIRSMEVSAGGQAPRVHSIDDYFMVDVEQGADDSSTAAGSSSSKRRNAAPAVTAQEYQYDADLEPSYWKSLLRAAVKTLGDGLHPLVLLDAPALKGEKVREVWSAVQGAGAELLVVNPLTTDPQVRRDAHSRGAQGTGLSGCWGRGWRFWCRSLWSELWQVQGSASIQGLHNRQLELQAVAWLLQDGSDAPVLCMCMYLLQVCFKQNVHKHSLEFIQAQAEAFETVPATFTCADASSLFEDKQQQKQPGGLGRGRHWQQLGCCGGKLSADAGVACLL